MGLLGFLLITSASVVLGIQHSAERRMRVEILGSLIAMLNSISCEITSRRTPLNEIFRRVSQSADSNIKAFAEYIYSQLKTDTQNNFCEHWALGTENFLNCLSTDSKETFIRLGSFLGRYDAELQSDAISRCISDLEHEYILKKDKQRDNERLCIALWGSAGMIVSLILI